MRGRDEIDIAAAIILQFEHRLGQLLDCGCLAVAMVTDVEVLAEHTAQIAACEENRAGAAAADKDAFLAEVRTDRTDTRHIADTAKALLIIAPLDPALTGTQRAGIHGIPQPLNGFAVVIHSFRAMLPLSVTLIEPI